MSLNRGVCKTMKGNEKAWYAAFKSKDARFDGHFFVGVASTGIYCRPICRAKLPRAGNCTYYATAAEAEWAGFRPCLQCRPELAPGTAPVDAAASLARRAAGFLEENCGDMESLEELAAHLGCTGRHLRRVFTAEFNVSPIQYLQTLRLLLAKNLLTSTRLSVLDVAMSAGFGSLRRFNELFKKEYRLSPAALRKLGKGGKEEEGSGITLTLPYRPPYRWERLLEFLALRAIPGVEAVRGGEYGRTVSLATRRGKDVYGWIRVGHCPVKNALIVVIARSLLPALSQVLARVRHLFDLYCDPAAVDETLAVMNGLSPGLYVPGTRLPGCFDPYELAVRTALGRQISMKAANALAGRLARSHGEPVRTGMEGLTHAFPAPGKILSLSGPGSAGWGIPGMTASRGRAVVELARAFEEGGIDFSFRADPEAEMKKLAELPGIGTWTAQYIAMRAFGWTDAFPSTDPGIREALAPRTQKEILALAEGWRPWRGYAAVNLWNSLKQH